MDNHNTKLCMKKFNDNISRQQAAEIEKRLKSVSDDHIDDIRQIELKSAKRTVAFSAVFGLFGGGSFYLGQVKRGLCKILFNVIVPFTVAIIFLFWLAPMNRQYSEQSAQYIEFSASMTADLSDFEYNYTLTDSNETADGPESSDGLPAGESALCDRGFSGNINSASELFGRALDDLKTYLDKISGDSANLRTLYNNPAGDYILTDNCKAINAAFAGFDNLCGEDNDAPAKYNYASYTNAINDIYSALVTVFPEMKDEENEEKTEKSVVEKLAAVAGEDNVKDNQELVENINLLIGYINILEYKNLNDYVEWLQALDLQNLLKIQAIETQEFAFEELEKAIAEIEECYKSNGYNLNEFINLCSAVTGRANYIFENILTDMASIKEIVDNVVDGGVYEAINSAYNVFSPTTIEGQDTPKSFEESMAYVLQNLDSLSGEAGEESMIPQVVSILQTMSHNYTATGLADKYAAVYEERTVENKNETVNLAEEYEKALKKFVTQNYDSKDTPDSNLSTLSANITSFGDYVDQIVENTAKINKVCNSGVFENSIYLVSAHATETLLQYYTCVDVNFYNESGESLLMYYLCGTHKNGADIKLGITDTLRDYYYNSQDIIVKAQTGLYNISTLEAIGQDLDNMQSEINSLNTRANTKGEEWGINAKLISAIVGLFFGMDMLIVAIYWVGEVFRDREKCYNLNFANICKELSMDKD